MAPITVSADIDRSAEDVFAYATDPTRFNEWQQGVLDGKMDKAGNPTVGDQCLTTRRIGFADRPVTSRVSHIDPPRTWGVRGVDGPIRASVDVSVEPISDRRATLTIAIDFEGHGIGKVLVPLIVRRQARKEMPDNLAALQRQLENQPCPP